MGLAKYLKAAFLGRWNLLAFLGGMGFALLSGRPDIVAPLVLAGETAYLGFLGTHSKFQKYVDAQAAKASRSSSHEVSAAAARRMLLELPREEIQRFEAVRSRCAELRRLAGQIRNPERSDQSPPLDDLQVAGLDRLLWMYLRLLYTQYSLTQFLKKTNPAQIEADINKLEGQLKQFPEGTPEPRQQRLQKVVQENLQTSKARLANYQRARENHELMGLEIDRLENTIHSLSELAINRQDPDFITAQIDQVAKGMVQTEQTMGQLSFVTGLELANEDAPPMLRETAAIRE